MKNKGNKQKTVTNIVDINPTISQQIKIQDPTIYCLQETHPKYKDTEKIKVKAWRKICHANINQQKAGVAILILHRTDLKVRKVIKDKERHYIMIQGSVLQDITILNVYESKNRASKQAKIDRLARRINQFTITVGVSTSLYQQLTDPTGRKSLRAWLNQTAPPINWI